MNSCNYTTALISMLIKLVSDMPSCLWANSFNCFFLFFHTSIHRLCHLKAAFIIQKSNSPYSLLECHTKKMTYGTPQPKLVVWGKKIAVEGKTFVQIDVSETALLVERQSIQRIKLPSSLVKNCQCVFNRET